MCNSLLSSAGVRFGSSWTSEGFYDSMGLTHTATPQPNDVLELGPDHTDLKDDD